MGPRSMTASWWLRRWAAFDPGKVALVFGDERLTYGELDARVDAVCGWLRSLGVEQGDRVAVLLRNCPAFLELYLACSRSGWVFVPLNFRLRAEELAYLLSDSEPRVLLYGAGLEGTIDEWRSRGDAPDLIAVRVAGGDAQTTRASGADSLEYATEVAAHAGLGPVDAASSPAVNPEGAQVIMYTSGTTGRPKGAVLSHRKTFFNSLNAEMFFDLTSADVMLIVTPLFHSGALFIQASPSLYKGCTIVLHEHFAAEQVLHSIEAYGVTKFQGVPTIYRRLLDALTPQRDLSSLGACAVGGEPVHGDLIERCAAAGFPLRQIMGQTETSILLWCTQEEMRERPGTVGRPVFHAEVELLDDDGRAAAPGQVGEIVVRGSVCMNGYWRQPAETALHMRDGWLHTGDLARRDEDGYFYLVDRAKDMYISGGENVYPAEVERVLSLLPGVAEVAVLGQPDEKWGEVGHAFVVPCEGERPDGQDIFDYCALHLATYKHPSHVTFCTRLPRTATGKVQKHVLRAWLLACDDLPDEDDWTPG